VRSEPARNRVPMRAGAMAVEDSRLEGLENQTDYPWFKDRYRMFPAVFEGRGRGRIIDLSGGFGCAAFPIKEQYRAMSLVTFEHLSHLEQFLKQTRRILFPDGVIGGKFAPLRALRPLEARALSYCYLLMPRLRLLPAAWASQAIPRFQRGGRKGQKNLEDCPQMSNDIRL